MPTPRKSAKVVSQGPCPHCTSSDAYTTYDDGGAYCYSCEYLLKSTKDDIPSMDADTDEVRYHPHRGLKEATLKKYGIVTKYVDDKPTATAFPYATGVKIRDFSEKKFWTKGEMNSPGCFGVDKFDPGSLGSVTITEGEYDAASIYQVTSGKTAALAVPSSTQAKKACMQNYAFINSFDQIILALDNDEQGRKASAAIAGLFDPQKILFVNFAQHKDANEYLQANKAEELYKVWAGASKGVPAGIIHSFEDIKNALAKHQEARIAEYPWTHMQTALKGLHKGEFVLFKGLEGIGKTEIFRALEYHVMKTTDENIGIIRLEESYGDTIRGVATYELQTPAMDEDAGISDEVAFDAYVKAVGEREDRVYIQSSFDTSDPDEVINNIRFLVGSCGCSVIFLDHLSMLVTGVEEEDERKKLDYIVTRLKKMAVTLGFCLVSIMHVNDNGQTRSSRYPPKIANTVVSLNRDIKNPDPVERRKTWLVVEKGRGQGCKTGPIGAVIYDNEDTFTLKEDVAYSQDDDVANAEEMFA